MPEFTKDDWVSQHVKHWQSWIGHLAGKPNVKALELGCYEGRSALWFCEHILTGDGSRLTTVDVWWNQDDMHARAVRNLALCLCDVLRTSTRRALADALVAGRQFAFIYIDADHHASNVLADMCGAWQVLAPGGVMICDDYGWTSRKRSTPPHIAIDAWLDCHRDKIDGYEVLTNQAAIWKPT